MKSAFIILFSMAIMGSSDRTRSAVSSLWVVESNSTLNIQGSSNINDFRCDVTEYLKKDTLCFDKDEKNKKLNFNSSCVTISINSFDCHQKYITGDLRKTLKADENPFLKIHFISIDDFTLLSDNSSVNATIDISLANVVKRVNIKFNAKKTGSQKILLTGDKELLFSDFGLKPPRKLAGLIKIKEEIKVHFGLALKSI